jgi:hypothetical protein
MPLYYFKLVDGRIVSDYGVQKLQDDEAAQAEAIKLARSVRASHPELVGKNCSIAVSVEGGGAVCIIPLRHPSL